MEYSVHGPIELLLAKVKNASGRIGIFKVAFHGLASRTFCMCLNTLYQDKLSHRQLPVLLFGGIVVLSQLEKRKST